MTTAASGRGSKRTLPSAIQDAALEGPAPKKPKKETKLDKLKAQLKADAARLKKRIDSELKVVKDKGVAKESVLETYFDLCDDILAGNTLDEDALALVKLPFANHFAEDVLCKELDQCMLPRRKRSASLMRSHQRRW